MSRESGLTSSIFPEGDQEREADSRSVPLIHLSIFFHYYEGER